MLRTICNHLQSIWSIGSIAWFSQISILQKLNYYLDRPWAIEAGQRWGRWEQKSSPSSTAGQQIFTFKIGLCKFFSRWTTNVYFNLHLNLIQLGNKELILVELFWLKNLTGKTGVEFWCLITFSTQVKLLAICIPEASRRNRRCKCKLENPLVGHPQGYPVQPPRLEMKY